MLKMYSLFFNIKVGGKFMNRFQREIYNLAKTSFKVIKRNSNSGKELTFKRHYGVIKSIYNSKEYSNLKIIREAHDWYRQKLR